MSTPEQGHTSYEIPITRSCFGCGTENDAGLGLKPVRDGPVVRAEYRPRAAHRGFTRTLHGGIIAALFDEVTAMAVATEVGAFTATVELTVRFRAPVPMEEGLLLEARDAGPCPEDPRRRVAEATLTGEGGELYATARGVYQPLSIEKLGRFIEVPEER
ncbi:MAG: PaaI family thioesterase [Myxococcales bacterium]|nr:PaaI family thioesterase [Myxococcales bacterium]